MKIFRTGGRAPWPPLLLTGAALQQWQRDSWLARWIGLLGPWQRHSVLLAYGDALGAGAIALTFALAPFVSTDLIGVLMLAAAGLWFLLTVADGRSWRSAIGVGTDDATETGAGKISAGFTPIHLLLLLYWGLNTIAMALSPVPKAAAAGWSKLTLYLLFFALMARVLRVPRWRSALIAVYLHVALVVSCYGLRQWFFGATALATWVDAESPLAKTTRVYSYLGNPNLLSSYLIPAVMLSLAALFAWRRPVAKLLAAVMLGVNGICLILTFSRGGWIGMLAGLTIAAIALVDWWSVKFSPFWRRWALPILLGGGTAFLAIAITLVEPLRLRVGSIFALRGDSSNNFRLNVWLSVLEMIRDHPWLGIGPGNSAFNRIYPLYQRPRFTALSAYSVLLEVAVESGLVGLTAFLWLLMVIAHQGLSAMRRLRATHHPHGYWAIAAIASVGGLLGQGFVDTVWYRPQVNMLWWFSVAIVASFYQGPPAPDRTPQPET
ncbi:MAG: IctB family putative bicarbonate transporter [Cyanobacteria bacterium]|nr:IctB family putative bicarbonate transporter [Cyanobacteriota bacterium]